MAEYLLHIPLKSELERLVPFVKDECHDTVKHELAALDVVKQAPGCGYEYVGQSCERVGLFAHVVAAVEYRDLVTLSDRTDDLENLQCEFA